MDKNKLEKELLSFKNLWKGGTTLSKQGWDKCQRKRIEFQDLNKIVETCIKPYVNAGTNVLEIGCNGGGWTQHFFGANEIYGFDALNAKHTKFWDNIKKKDNIHYFQVKDFNCNELVDNTINYVFSYDVFCHISYSGASAYLKNLFKKLKKGADCFIMIADANKYFNIKGRKKLMKCAGFSNFDDFVKDYDGDPNNGRWYWYGTELFCEKLKEYGYIIVDKDVAINSDKLNPIIHFRK